MARTERTPLPAVIQEQRDQGFKWCHGCAEFHPFADFGPSKERPDGLNPRCREAARRVDRENHAKRRREAFRGSLVCEAVKSAAPEGKTWCNIHAGYCDTSTFGREPRKANGLQSSCNPGQVQKKSAARNPPKRITSKYNPAPEGTKWCYWHKAFEPTEQFREGARRCNEATREFSRSTPEVNAAKSRRRRARFRKVEGSHTAAEILALGESQGWICATPSCGADIRNRYDADHKTPITRGGSDFIENIDLKCQSCNRRKGTKTQEEWLLCICIV